MASFARQIMGSSTARLRSFAGLQPLVGSKVYYTIPSTVTVPYLSVDAPSRRRADGTELRASEVDLLVHVWTKGTELAGTGIRDDPIMDAHAIAEEVANALHEYALPIADGLVVTLDHRGERVFYDVDGETAHGVVEFIAHVQRPD